MERELKFRAYHKSKKEMLSVFSFCYEFIKVVTDIDLVEKFSVNEFSELMQFTGEKDICSADIFKGDILQCENDKIYLVDFRKGSWVIVHAPTCGREREGECKTDYLHDALKALELEVIGNEYQTPELLTN